MRPVFYLDGLSEGLVRLVDALELNRVSLRHFPLTVLLPALRDAAAPVVGLIVQKRAFVIIYDVQASRQVLFDDVSRRDLLADY